MFRIPHIRSHVTMLHGLHSIMYLKLRDKVGLSKALERLKCASNLCSCYDKQHSNPSINSTNVCCGGCDHLHQVKLLSDDGSSSSRKSNTSQIVDAFFKLYFLKILIVDIGISLGWSVSVKSIV